MKYEDLNLAMQTIERGGRTTKCCEFAYRAAHYKRGGCESARNDETGDLRYTQLSDLIGMEDFYLIPNWRKLLILELVQWARSHELQSGVKASAFEPTQKTRTVDLGVRDR